MTNTQLYSLRVSTPFLNRIETALMRYAVYLRGLGEGATQQQTDWQSRVFTNGEAAQLAQRVAWEVIFNPIVAEAVYAEGLPALPDTGAGSLQVAVETCCLKY